MAIFKQVYRCRVHAAQYKEAFIKFNGTLGRLSNGLPDVCNVSQPDCWQQRSE
jgi:hypothetical protein